MLHATWSSNECLGASALERLHHDLFNALEKLSTVQDDEFGDGYRALVQQVERTFQKEESWMEEMDSQSLKVHREQHARVLGALHNVNCRVMNGELGLGREVVGALLPQWFAFHISTMDATLARSMRAMAVPQLGALITSAIGEKLESH